MGGLQMRKVVSTFTYNKKKTDHNPFLLYMPDCGLPFMRRMCPSAYF